MAAPPRSLRTPTKSPQTVHKAPVLAKVQEVWMGRRAIVLEV